MMAKQHDYSMVSGKAPMLDVVFPSSDEIPTMTKATTRAPTTKIDRA